MIQKLTNDYKYRPHVILGSLAIAVVITSLATGALIALHGDIQNAFRHQHIAMLCLCSTEAVAFTSFCLLAVARMRMKHNYAEDVDKLLTTPQALTGVRPLKSSRLPVRLIVYISQFAGDREMLILCLKFGIPITNKKYYEKFKQGFVQLCASHDRHKRYFTPFYRGIMGVLSYQNLSFDKAVAIVKQHNGLSHENGHGFVLAMNLLLGPHEAADQNDEELLKGYNFNELYGVEENPIIKKNDIDTIKLFLKSTTCQILSSTVKSFANENTALLLLRAKRLADLEDVLLHACLMGWAEFVNECFKHRVKPLEASLRFLWQNTFEGAVYQQQLLSHKPPYNEGIFKRIRNIVRNAGGYDSSYAHLCEQIINGQHVKVAEALLKQRQILPRRIECEGFKWLNLTTLPLLQFIEIFNLQEFIKLFEPMKPRLLDPKRIWDVYFE